MLTPPGDIASADYAFLVGWFQSAHPAEFARARSRRPGRRGRDD